MLRSMTGFGRCLLENDIGRQHWEIRSVNGRQLDFKWRLPQLVRHLEVNLEKIARRHAHRGRVEIFLDLSLNAEYAPGSVFNMEIANSMLERLAELARLRNEAFQPDYTMLLGVATLWSEPRITSDDGLLEQLRSGFELALEDWNDSRSIEGKALGMDLLSRIIRMEEWVELLANLAPEVRSARLAALRDRLNAALDGIELDENRFAQEIVILADKVDATEELTRLGTHLERLRELLENSDGAGRRLDFTLQECFREINTCGNKLQDAQVSGIIVDFKNELEKCREQAMNLE